jgi:hypothetical protein
MNLILPSPAKRSIRRKRKAYVRTDGALSPALSQRSKTLVNREKSLALPRGIEPCFSLERAGRTAPSAQHHVDQHDALQPGGTPDIGAAPELPARLLRFGAAN